LFLLKAFIPGRPWILPQAVRSDIMTGPSPSEYPFFLKEMNDIRPARRTWSECLILFTFVAIRIPLPPLSDSSPPFPRQNYCPHRNFAGALCFVLVYISSLVRNFETLHLLLSPCGWVSPPSNNHVRPSTPFPDGDVPVLLADFFPASAFCQRGDFSLFQIALVTDFLFRVLRKTPSRAPPHVRYDIRSGRSAPAIPNCFPEMGSGSFLPSDNRTRVASTEPSLLFVLRTGIRHTVVILVGPNRPACPFSALALLQQSSFFPAGERGTLVGIDQGNPDFKSQV